MMSSETAKQPANKQSFVQRATSSVPLKARLRWYSRRWLRSLGWPGVVALGMMIACPSLYVSAIRPMQQHVQEVQRDIVSLREQKLREGDTAQSKLKTPVQQLAEFYRAFPAERYSPQWLEKLLGIAEQNNLVLNEGEYKTSREKVGKLVRYQIIFPVRGEYPQIREFLASIPEEIPIIALESVQFERQNVADSSVEAKIKLVLYLEQVS